LTKEGERKIIEIPSQFLFSKKMPFLENLNWRNATKDFDPERSIGKEDFQKILDSIRLAPTSFGLEPFHICLVKNPEIRKKIREVAWNQPQITEASELLVFCSRSDVSEHRIDEWMNTMSGGNREIREKMVDYEKMMKNFFSGMSEAEQKDWADRQAYLALGFALAASAELRIDSCPMEGFDPVKTDEILDLPQTLKSVVLLTLGYRKSDPTHPKVRFPHSELFSEI